MFSHHFWNNEQKEQNNFLNLEKANNEKIKDANINNLISNVPNNSNKLNDSFTKNGNSHNNNNIKQNGENNQ